MFELSRELMAGLALAVFWIHTLLIALAAVKDLRELAAMRRGLRELDSPREGLGLIRARIVEGAGPEATLARNVVAQVGRGKGDGKVHFSDADHRSELHGGLVELASGERLRLDAGPAMVWPDLDERSRLAAPSSPDHIAEVVPQARRGKGWKREVEVALGPGSEVWIGGRFSQAEAGWRVEPDAALGDRVLVAGIEPRAWLRGRNLLIAAFVFGTLSLAGVCTALALWPPVFGLLSMLGAAAALGFFLGVQPLGVTLNEQVRTPDRAYLRGTWG